MSYQKGELEVGEDYNGDFTVDVAKLPHSCDKWVIGGVQEIDDLIADLTEAKEKLGGKD